MIRFHHGVLSELAREMEMAVPKNLDPSGPGLWIEDDSDQTSVVVPYDENIFEVFDEQVAEERLLAFARETLARAKLQRASRGEIEWDGGNAVSGVGSDSGS